MFALVLWFAGCQDTSIVSLKDDVVEAEDTDTVMPDTDAPDTVGPDTGSEPVDPVETADTVDPVDTPVVDTPVVDTPVVDTVDTPPADTVDTIDTPVDTALGANPCGPPVIDPYVLGGNFGGFQSMPGSGYQVTITVTLPCPATSARVTILDPDYPANDLIAYDGAVEVDRARFIGDGMPGVYTTDVRQVSAPRITRLELVPDPIDYVAYDLVLYY
jgi:hypothetical protein